jgi:hypothetical protein
MFDHPPHPKPDRVAQPPLDLADLQAFIGAFVNGCD